MDSSILYPTRYQVSVPEMRALIKSVENFYTQLGNPKMNVIWLANLILRRLKNDRDYYINCEGEKGSGKSNLMLLLALLICRYAGLWRNKLTGQVVRVLPRPTPLDETKWEQMTVGFDFDNNMSFLDNVEKVSEKFNKIDRYMPFVIDEGSKNLHKYQWQSKLQFKLIQMSDTERYQNKAFFVCFPNFKELNSVFRNDRVRMRLYVYARHTTQNYASCIISLRDVNRWIVDPWHMDENAKSFEYLLKRVPAATRNFKHILYAEKKLKGYAGNFEFPSLQAISPRIWNIYMKYKLDNAKKENEGEGPTKEHKTIIKWKYATKMLMAWVKEKYPEVTWDDFKKLTNVSTQTLNKLWREKLEVEDEMLLKQRAGAATNKPIENFSVDS